MSCSCNSLTNTDGSSASFILGEIKRIKLNIYQPKDNAVLEGECNPSRSNIVIPTTISVTFSEIDFYLCTDMTVSLLNDTPTVTDIIDSKSQKIGVQLSYSVDTSISPLNVAGDYVAVFKYTIDSLETFIVPFYFSITTVSCSISGSC